MGKAIDPATAKAMAEANAMLVVGQACGAVVTDGATYFGSVAAVSATAVGTFTAGMVAQVIATGNPNKPLKFKDAIQDVQDQVTAAGKTFESVGKSAAAVMKEWKSI